MTKQFLAKFKGVCHSCGNPINVGDPITWTRTRNAEGKKQRWHQGCPNPTGDTPTPKQPVDVPVTPAKPVTPAIPVTAHPATTTVPTQDGDIMKRLADAIGPFIQLNGDALKTEILALVDDRLKSVQTVKHLYEITHSDGHKVVMEGLQHYLFQELLDLLALPETEGEFRTNVYLHGMPGSGKSKAGILAAVALDLPRAYIALTPSTPESKLFGYMSGMTGEYVETDFYRLYRDGGVFVIDEGDNSNPVLQAALNGALENGDCAFPCGLVPRHPNFVCVMTGNTAGYGASKQFPGRQVMDAAFRERFAFVSWETDEALERSIALSLNPRVTAWIDWVQKVRVSALQSHPTLLVTARASINGAKLLRKFDPLKVAHMVIFKGLNKDSVRAILADNPIPAVSEVR